MYKHKSKARKVLKKRAKQKKPISRKANSMERIPTEIKNFDALVEGGFEKNSINLLVGGSGSGKTIFAIQFLIAGMKKGEKCLYVTFEEKKKEFYYNMLDFGWDLEKLENEKKFVFFRIYP